MHAGPERAGGDRVSDLELGERLAERVLAVVVARAARALGLEKDIGSIAPGKAADLVVSYGGSLSGEHGDGLARSEFNRSIFGDDLYEVDCLIYATGFEFGTEAGSGRPSRGTAEMRAPRARWAASCTSSHCEVDTLSGQITARTSSFAFKGRDADVRRELIGDGVFHRRGDQPRTNMGMPGISLREPATDALY